MFVTTTITYDGEVAQKVCKIKWESDEDTKITVQKGIRDLRNGYMSN